MSACIIRRSLDEMKVRMDAIEAALAGPSAAEVEAKFANFWPRKIMILFGPPCAVAPRWGPALACLSPMSCLCAPSRRMALW